MNRFVAYSLKPKTIIVNLAILLGVFIFGSIMHEVILHLDEAVTTFPFGTVLLLMTMAGLSFFANWQQEPMQFQLSISMGCTRRRFIISYSLQYFALMFILWVVIFLFYHLEVFRLGLMYPEAYMELSLDALFHPLSFVLVPFAALCVGLFIGGIGLRFGSTSRIIVLAIWIGLCFTLTRVEAVTNFIENHDYSAGFYAGVALVIALILGGVSLLMIRKQRVDM